MPRSYAKKLACATGAYQSLKSHEIISLTEGVFGILKAMAALSDRLKLIFDQLRPNLPVWDICCDHGYLGIHAYQSGQFPAVHFVDQVPEIVQRLEDRFHKVLTATHSATKVSFKALSGESIPEEVTGNLVISGVGSYTIFQILKSLQEKNLLKAERLILCPQNDVVSIEEIKKLPDFSFRQSQENLSVYEKDRLRRVFVFDRV